MTVLHRTERELLRRLAGKGEVELKEIAEGNESDVLRRAASWLQQKGLAELKEEEHVSVLRTKECGRYLEGGFPEVRVLEHDGKKVSSLPEEEKRIGVMWALKNGWAKVEGGVLRVKKRPKEYAVEDAARSPEKAGAEEIGILVKRGLLEEKKGHELYIRLTKEGENEAKKAGKEKEEIGQVTHEVITGGGWKGKAFAPYAVAPVADAPLGKKHPLTRKMGEIKRIFADMGFEEMEGGIVQAAFWNFDALFQPQDHPARELADTFYLEGKGKLPEKALVEKVREAHEAGWGYEWSEKEAERLVLRTHTTALSAQYLHKLGKGESGKKYFSIGRVFRNEATDFKHLAEFYQVEGIVAWEGATFAHLMGVLKEFYRRMGFEKIRFRPSYFPYTEPSLEIEVFFEERGEWMELGGAGIFRPEMTKPLCDVYPVLAWGLSLERPVMLASDLKDIRTFYKNDLDWLRNSRLKE